MKNLINIVWNIVLIGCLVYALMNQMQLVVIVILVTLTALLFVMYSEIENKDKENEEGKKE